MREGWSKSTLGEIASLVTSGSRGWGSFYAETGNPFIRMTNLPREGIKLDLSDLRYVQLPKDSSEGQRTSVRQGDILISITAELGKIGYVDFAPELPAFVNQHVCLVRTSDSKVDPEFLASYLAVRPQRKFFNRLNDSGAKAGLNLQTIRSYSVSFPSIYEQRKIAAILRIWDEALEKLNAMRAAKARQLGGLGLALLDRAADEAATVSKPLAELVRIIKGKQLNKLDIASGEFPVWNGGISPSGFHDEWNTEGGTITISEGGNSCGFVNLSDTRFWLGGHCYALQELSSMVERDFLFHALKSRELEIMRLRVGSGLPNIQRGDLERLQVVVPPRDLQKKIALALTAGNEELTLLDTEIEALTRQKRGLMQKLLTGEWRVEVSDDEEAAA